MTLDRDFEYLAKMCIPSMLDLSSFTCNCHLKEVIINTPGQTVMMEHFITFQLPCDPLLISCGSHRTLSSSSSYSILVRGSLGLLLEAGSQMKLPFRFDR